MRHVPLLALLGCTSQIVPVADAASAAPDFTLRDLDGREHHLADLRGKTVVLEWFNPGCPFVQQAHGDGGALDTLAADTTKDGDVVWLAINSSAPGKQGHGVDANQAAAASWSLGHPILLDESGQVGKLYGAATTPHVFVVDPEGVLRYAGAVDNAPLGKHEGAYVNYLTKALADLDAGRAVATPQVKPYGCSVKY